MSRRYPARPIVGVGGIVLCDGQVLCVRRGGEPGRGLWSIPGGAVELGERLTEACAREVAEETGLAVEVGPLVTAFERIARDAEGRVEYHYVLLDYLCSVERAATPVAGDDAMDAAWVTLDGLEARGLTPDTIAVIRAAAAMAPNTPWTPLE